MLGLELNRGRFATAFAAKNTASGRSEAVKVICRRQLAAGNEWGNIANEFDIMRSMLAHPTS